MGSLNSGPWDLSQDRVQHSTHWATQTHTPMCLFFKVRAKNRTSGISKRAFFTVQRVSVPILSMVLGGSRFSDTHGSCYLRQWESSLKRKYDQLPLFPFQGSICGSQVTHSTLNALISCSHWWWKLKYLSIISFNERKTGWLLFF